MIGIFRDLSDLLFPRHCAACGKKLTQQEHSLCCDCLENMPLTYYWLDKFNPMADKLNAGIEEKLKYSMDTEQYAYALSLYYYKGDYKKLSQALKYHARVKLGAHLGKLLAERISQTPWLSDVDLIIPVPLHPLRYWKRGYNQAEIIARSAYSCLTGNGPGFRKTQNGFHTTSVRTDLLFRTRNTKSQVKLPVAGKSSNVSGAFTVDEKRLSCALNEFACHHRKEIRHVLLIDDVFTTGSTLVECHRAFRTALTSISGREDGGKVRISVATLAVVGD